MRPISGNNGIGIKCEQAVSIDLDSHVASFSPSRAPGVSDDPVFNTIVDSPSNDSNNMIMRTTLAIKDTTSILLKAWSNFNIGSDWTTSKILLRIPYSCHSWDLGFNLGWIESACSSNSFIRVGRAVHGSSCALNVLESDWRPTSITTLASSCTINHLLLWESDLASLLDCKSALKSADGSEWPARTALPLIPDWRHTSPPVNWSVRSSWSLRNHFNLRSFLALDASSQMLADLLWGHVRELVNSFVPCPAVSLICRIVLYYLLEAIFEESLSEVIFFLCLVEFGMLSQVLVENLVWLMQICRAIAWILL